jgi:antitoxin component YwqK of YwqJK toxin-antitoxin module
MSLKESTNFIVMKKLLLLLLFIPLVSCQDVEVRETYYDSGELESTVNYVDGLAQGEWKYYWESGTLRSIVNYVDDLRQGEKKYYYESGGLIVFDRKKLIKTFHDNGQLKMEGVYADIDSLEFLLGKVIWQGNGGYYVGVTFEGGYFDDEKKMQITGIEAYRKVTEKPIKDDKWTYYYESGKIEKEESYNVNFLNKVINYSEKGFKTSEIGYGLKEGWLLAEETKYYENGRTKSVYSESYEGSYSAKYYENGQMEWEDWGDGTIKTYYENGTIKSEDYDDYEGSYSAKYYENGQMEMEITLEGEIKYYESVELKDTVNYVDGLRQGEEKEYYDSGELQYTSNYVDDLKQGEFKEYYESGELRSTVNYVDGLRQGEEKEYYDSGELQYTSNYVDDLKQGESKEYFESGELKRTVNYIDGKRQGYETSYFDLKDNPTSTFSKTSNSLEKVDEMKRIISSTVDYVDDIIQGEAKYYNILGKLIKTVNFVDGVEQ